MPAGSRIWVASSLASGLGTVILALIAVYLALQGKENLSNLTTGLMILAMGVFVLLQFVPGAHRPPGVDAH
jgi:amino acid permease